MVDCQLVGILITNVFLLGTLVQLSAIRYLHHPFLITVCLEFRLFHILLLLLMVSTQAAIVVYLITSVTSERQRQPINLDTDISVSTPV